MYQYWGILLFKGFEVLTAGPKLPYYLLPLRFFDVLLNPLSCLFLPGITPSVQ
jgi:hypothetical protein